MLFSLQAYADEFSKDLQKACINEQLSRHKDIKSQAIESNYFNEYCKCETDYIINKATKEQLNQVYKKPTTTPHWLSQLKSKALKSCIGQEKKITT